MNWQDDPEIQRNIQVGRVRGRLLRSSIIWGPPFIASAAALVFFTFDRITGPSHGSTWFLVVVLAILTALFGFQAIQSFMDFIGQPKTEQGYVTRRWTRNDSLVLKTHYIRLDRMILRGDAYSLDGIREGDYVEATYYPHSAVVVWVEKRDAPAAEQASTAN